MTVITSIVLWFVAASITLPMLVVAGECLAGLSWGRREGREPGDAEGEHRRSRASVAVLVPAHNEALGIAATLAAIKAQLTPRDRLIVVADNCTDDTARIARETGAEVFERTDVNHRDKSYALAAGVASLRDHPRAVVICFDADCQLGPGRLMPLPGSLLIMLFMIALALTILAGALLAVRGPLLSTGHRGGVVNRRAGAGMVSLCPCHVAGHRTA